MLSAAKAEVDGRSAAESKGGVEARGGFLKRPGASYWRGYFTQQNEQCCALLTYLDFALRYSLLRRLPLRTALGMT
ncbi:MAG: hypothetical protein ABR545_09295 [Cyclonatronaceae bacterium]